MVFIADYGAGNLRSVHKAFDYLGVKALVSDNPSGIASCKKVVIPGVGAYGPAMEALTRQGFTEAIREHVDRGGQVLGICLGMQLFLTGSEEMGAHRGLGFIPGNVLHFESETDKIPQIGWNSVDLCRKDSVLFRNIPDHSWFYFVHSYYCSPEEPGSVAATTFFAGNNFCSAIEKNGIFAVQFHPEKSSASGLQVLKNFAEC